MRSGTACLIKPHPWLRARRCVLPAVLAVEEVTNVDVQRFSHREQPPGRNPVKGGFLLVALVAGDVGLLDQLALGSPNMTRRLQEREPMWGSMAPPQAAARVGLWCGVFPIA